MDAFRSPSISQADNTPVWVVTFQYGIF